VPFIDPSLVKTKEVKIETYTDSEGIERTRKRVYFTTYRVKPLPPKEKKLPKFIPLFD
tara:strand:- start:1464 stop:1637 length:174 start_codon:yes stop_codon:yes gene_type:complete